MKRERIEDLGCIKILIDQALDNNVFENILGEWSYIENIQDIDAMVETYNHILADICSLKLQLEQIQEYAEGFEDGI